MSDPIDIGHGVTLYFKINERGEEYAIIETHAGADGKPCAGWCYLRGVAGNEHARSTWIVEQREPLTLSPSVLCTTCGHHGFVRGGQWVPA